MKTVIVDQSTTATDSRKLSTGDNIIRSDLDNYYKVSRRFENKIETR
jgi:hypothetical protein